MKHYGKQVTNVTPSVAELPSVSVTEMSALPAATDGLVLVTVKVPPFATDAGDTVALVGLSAVAKRVPEYPASVAVKVYECGPVGGQPPLFPTAPAAGSSTINAVAVGDGDGLGDGEGDGDGVGVGEGDGLGLGFTDGDGEGLGAIDGDGLGATDGDGDGEGDAVGSAYNPKLYVTPPVNVIGVLVPENVIVVSETVPLPTTDHAPAVGS